MVQGLDCPALDPNNVNVTDLNSNQAPGEYRRTDFATAVGVIIV